MHYMSLVCNLLVITSEAPSSEDEQIASLARLTPIDPATTEKKVVVVVGIDKGDL